MKGPLPRLIMWIIPWILPFIKATIQDKHIIRCNFEQLELCPFEQDPNDELDWDLYHSPPVSALLRGPYSDHTYGKVIGFREGHVVADLLTRRSRHYARLATPPNTTGGLARIMTPPLQLTAGNAEVTFFYHMFDPVPSDFKGTINVYGCNRDLVWSRSINLGNFWVKATIKISCDEPFRVIFEGIIGAKDSDLAIDDVDVTDRFNITPSPNPSMDPDGTKSPREVTPRGANGEPTIGITLYPNGEGPPVGPGTNDDVDPDIALSLVTVAVALFAATCLMLLVTVIIHYKVCSQRRKNHYPSHIVYHGPSYYNRDVERHSHEGAGYMTLNFDGSRASSSGTATEFLTMSDRHDTTRSKNGDRISLGSFTRASSFSEPRPRLPTRRESRTFPIVRELKNLLHAVHMRRIRTLSQHLSVAEIEMLRHQLSSRSTATTQPEVSHDRTMSTILLDTSASTIRPMSEISEHFYYSLFPDPNSEGGGRVAARRQDARTPLVSSRPVHTSSVAQSSPLVDTSGRTVGESHASSAGEEATHSAIFPVSEGSTAHEDITATTVAAGDVMEMVDNEIYESYTENEVSC
ncbi:uncharacterized protein [Diadema antillarum]|uniref:uncharacterized protein n=1 Tax=Diadema antillarum TaxID=105358 RepID=UPI003A8BDEBB